MTARVRPWVAVAMVACSDPECALNLEQELHARAGANAVDCGVVPLDGDATATDQCVVAAFSSGQPFYAQYERRGGVPSLGQPQQRPRRRRQRPAL